MLRLNQAKEARKQEKAAAKAISKSISMAEGGAGGKGNFWKKKGGGGFNSCDVSARSSRSASGATGRGSHGGGRGGSGGKRKPFYSEFPSFLGRSSSASNGSFLDSSRGGFLDASRGSLSGHGDEFLDLSRRAGGLDASVRRGMSAAPLAR